MSSGTGPSSGPAIPQPAVPVLLSPARLDGQRPPGPSSRCVACPTGGYPQLHSAFPMLDGRPG
jgi:hypothetical protein